MSVYSFPRINIKGLLSINVCTTNNDDYSLQEQTDKDGNIVYSGYATLPQNGQLGQPLRLNNTAAVQPYDFIDPATGAPMTDAKYVEWIRTPQVFAHYKGTSNDVNDYQEVKMIPGEWNNFGDMGITAIDAKVVGVTLPSDTTDNGVEVVTRNDPFGVLGAQFSFNNRPGNTGRSTAMLIDVNPEAPQASQVFAGNVMLQKDGKAILSGKPSKAITRFINFQRNVFLTGPNGAAGTFQCAIPLSELVGQPILGIMQKYPEPGKTLKGVVFRYTMFRSLQKINTFNKSPDEWLTAITDLYAQPAGQNLNPTYVQISGTFSPWYEGEVESCPTGSFLVGDQAFPSPGGNGKEFQLAAAFVNWAPQSNFVSLDLSAALPDHYQPSDYNPLDQTNNPKFDLGPLTFGQEICGSYFPVGNLDYTDTSAGDAAGWIFDFKVPDFPESRRTTSAPEGEEIVHPQFVVRSPKYGNLLLERQYFFVSDQANCYGEQFIPTPLGWENMPLRLSRTETVFSSQAFRDTQISFRAFEWGQPIQEGSFDLWWMESNYVKPPKQGPQPRKLRSGYQLGDPIELPVDQPGVFIVTIVPTGGTIDDFSIATSPMINCRILPNYDLSAYFAFDDQGNPQPTPALDWEILYRQIMRSYYILYAAMSEIIPLNQPDQWVGPTLLTLRERVETSAWGTIKDMARTRDISVTRRWLLLAYITKFANQRPPANQRRSVLA